MSEQTKREEAAVENATVRPLEDAEAEKIVGGCGDNFWRHRIVSNGGNGSNGNNGNNGSNGSNGSNGGNGNST